MVMIGNDEPSSAGPTLHECLLGHGWKRFRLEGAAEGQQANRGVASQGSEGELASLVDFEDRLTWTLASDHCGLGNCLKGEQVPFYQVGVFCPLTY